MWTQNPIFEPTRNNDLNEHLYNEVLLPKYRYLVPTTFLAWIKEWKSASPVSGCDKQVLLPKYGYLTFIWDLIDVQLTQRHTSCDSSSSITPFIILILISSRNTQGDMKCIIIVL